VVFADNTDWEGFLRSWDESGLGSIEGKTAVILGAGGAADAIFYALAERGISSVFIFNRDKERAETLAEKFRNQYSTLEITPYALSYKSGLSSVLKSADILINTTPAGMHPAPDNMPVSIPASINENLVYYDLIYNPVKTKMAAELEKRNIKTACGLGMLVHQASLSFKRWFGLEPNPAPMFEKALEILGR
jgi:shikimate dehydrogenase